MELKNDRYSPITIPLARGLVTRYPEDQLAIGQHSILENLVHSDGLLRTRPAVSLISNGGDEPPKRIYSLFRWYAPDGTRYLFAVCPGAGWASLALHVKIGALTENWAELDGEWFTENDIRHCPFAALRDIVVNSDAYDEIKFIKKATTTPSYEGGPLGYEPPHKRFSIDYFILAASSAEASINPGIFQLATAFSFDDGESSNMGPRSNLLESQFMWHPGLRALDLSGITVGAELDSYTKLRILARSFPGRYKAYADDLFFPFYAREEKGTLTGTTHESSDPFSGNPAMEDNHLPPIPKVLLSARDTLVAVANKGPLPPVPFDQQDTTGLYYERCRTTKVARVTITNPNARTETRVPVKIQVTFSDLDSYGDNQSGLDFVWTEEDNISPCPFIRTAYVAGTSATFEVLIPEVPASGSVTLYLHYEADVQFTPGWTWLDIFTPELTRRSMIAHFYMDEENLEIAGGDDDIINRITDNHGEFEGQCLYAVAGNGPCWNHEGAKARTYSQDGYVYVDLRDTQYISLHNLGLTATLQQFSFSLFYKLPVDLSDPDKLEIIRYTKANAFGHWFALYVFNDGGTNKLWIRFYDDSTLEITVPFDNNEWYHIGFSADKSNNVKVAVTRLSNGTVYSDTATPDEVYRYDADKEWTLCQRCTIVFPPFNYAYFKNLAFFNYAMSAAELTAHSKRRGYFATALDIDVTALDDPTNVRPEHGARVYFSKKGLPHAFPRDSRHLIIDEDDGGDHIGAAFHKGDLVTFKKSRITKWKLDTVRDLWTRDENITPQAESLGLAATQLLTKGRLDQGDSESEVLFFTANDRKVYAFDGYETRWVGEPVDNQLEGKTEIQLQRSYLHYSPKHRFLFLAFNGTDNGGSAPASGLDDHPGIYCDNILIMQCDQWDPPLPSVSSVSSVAKSPRPRWTKFVKPSGTWTMGPAAVCNGPLDSLEFLFGGGKWLNEKLYTIGEKSSEPYQDDWGSGNVQIPQKAQPHLAVAGLNASWKVIIIEYAVAGQSTRPATIDLTPKIRDEYTRVISSLTKRTTVKHRQFLTLPRATIGDAMTALIEENTQTDRLELFNLHLSARAVGIKKGT